MEKRETWPAALNKFFHEDEDINPYATTATMRAYDQLLRNAAEGVLSQAAAQWRGRAQEFAQSIPQPSREQPFPPAEQMRQLKAFKSRADVLSQFASQVTALEVPSSDRVHHRVQNGTLLLETLIEMDRTLLYMLAEVLAVEDVETLDAKLAEVRGQLAARHQILTEVP